MLDKGIFTVAKNALLPGSERAYNIMAALKISDRVLCSVHRARNVEHNELAHAVFDRVAKATGLSLDVIKLWLKWETGRVDLVKLPNDKYMPNPRSLAFESMSQDEFQRFWDEAWVVLSEKMLPKIPEAEFEIIKAIVGGRAQ